MCLLKTVGEAEATYPQSCPKPHFYENFPKYFLNEKDKRQKTADKAAMTIKKQM